MSGWPDTRLTELFAIAHPILQAPMAGASTPEMAIAVGKAGGMGSLACAMLGVDETRATLRKLAEAGAGSLNVNFFCHARPRPEATALSGWVDRLREYYDELGLSPDEVQPGVERAPFDEAYCEVVEELRPKVVSFHFGLPEQKLLDRLRKVACTIIASATTVAEARWLEHRGCDAVIAMGVEAGGHRGSFLTRDMSRQVGTMALVPQVVDAVKVPVIAAGGIADARGIVAAFALGASAVQLGTAYLHTPEAKISAFHRHALTAAADDSTAVTNVFTGRPARGFVNRLVEEVGPLSDVVPPFPLASAALAPLRAAAEARGESHFTNLWAGQAAGLGRAEPAQALTERLAREALAHFSSLAMSQKTPNSSGAQS
ncbi:MAG: NAD(P)H-dependent flavin oxidoreductase [Myxococcota bacterium]